jgi:hypothetical protein
MYIVFIMANIKASPGERKIRLNFTLKEKLQPQLQEISLRLGVSMSQFVEESIFEKIERMDNEREYGG